MTLSLRRYLAVYRGLTRDAKLLILSGAIGSLPFGVIAVALPLYLKLLGYTEVVIGSFFTTVGVVAVVLVNPFGILADRFGRKRMIVAGGFLSSAAFFLLPLAGNYAFLYGIAALAGLSEALVFSTLQALLADASTPANRSAVFGISFFSTTVATAVGSLASSLPDLLRAQGWEVVRAYSPLFLGVGLAIVLAPILLLLVSLPETRKAARSGLFPRRSAGIIGKFFVANMVIGLGAGLIVPIFSLWFLLKFGRTESFTGPLFALGAVTNAFALLVAPILAERFGMVRTVYTLSALGTAVLLAMAFTPWLPVAAVLFLVRNAAMNMNWPVMSTFLMGVVDPEERSSASAVVGLSFRLPFAVSTIFGAAMMAGNPDLPLLVTSGLYAVGTTAFYAFFRGVPEPRKAETPVAGP